MLINLRNPDATFIQSDEVAGDVVYPDSSPATPFRLVVEFVGIVKTKASKESGSSYKTVHDEAEIVRLLVSDAQWNASVFPFSFYFPWSAPPLEDQLAPSGQPGTEWVPSPLPPSHEIQGGVDTKFLRTWVGSIEYKVRATIFPQNARVPLQQEVAINYSPVSDPRSQEDELGCSTDCVKDICVKSLLLLPENKDRKLTFGEKTKSLFQRSSLPNFNFKVITAHPSRITLGQPLHFVVRIELSPDTSSAPEIPEITLTEFGQVVMGDSKVRAQGVPNVAAPTMDIVFCSSNTDLGSFQLSHGYAKTISTPAFTHALPSFRTKNVTRTYSIMSVLRVKCAGKTFQWENKSDLVVLPPMRGAVLPDEPLLKWSLTKYPAVEWNEGDIRHNKRNFAPEKLPVEVDKKGKSQESQGFPLKS